MALYAMGGGLGHAVRAAALAGALSRRGASCLGLVPAPAEPWARALGLPTASPPSPEVLGPWVEQTLEAFAPDLLVVDVFPRGVLGELHEAPRVLLTRYVDPRFYLEPRIARAVDACQLVLWTERPAPELRCGVRPIPPVVSLQPADLLPRDRARAQLGVEGRFVLALGTGPAGLQRQLLEALREARRALRFELRFLSLVMPEEGEVLRRFPAGPWLRAADVVVAAAGYQAYYEVVTAGVPALFVPQPRKVDDQRARAAGGLGLRPRARWDVAASPAEVPARLGRLLDARPAPPLALRGAEVAARAILQELR